jgi:Zn finger protein HypA/HybF involved in hydrogenase expression
VTTSVVLVLAAAGALALYLVTCRIWPYGNCRRCHGSSKLHSPTGRSFRPCPRCKSTGRRLRIGRRVLNYMSARARDAL